MRRLAVILLIAALALLGLASQASATVITNNTVKLGLNPAGDLNDLAANIGLTYVPTGNDGTRQGQPAEGWGAGAGGVTVFQGRANEDLGGGTGFTQGSFSATASTATSVVDILRGGLPALRLTQDFHPSPTTENLYEITTTSRTSAAAR
jgi:hypothetical protein